MLYYNEYFRANEKIGRKYFIFSPTSKCFFLLLFDVLNFKKRRYDCKSGRVREITGAAGWLVGYKFETEKLLKL